jgi:hypothetical protein
MERSSDGGLPVGRDAELAQLSGYLEEVAERGTGGTVAVVGPLGSGKSALLATAASMASSLEHAVRQVDASPRLQTQPLGLAQELFGPVPTRPDRQARPEVGFDTTPLGTADTLEFLERAEQLLGQPLLLVVDDLDWADRWSLLLLARLRALIHPERETDNVAELNSGD